MRSPALFTILLVATGTAASAEPKPEETSGRVSYKTRNGPRRPADWIELASPTPAAHGTELVLVGKSAGSFAQLRIEAARGKTIVLRVKVFFVDGTNKKVWLAKPVTGAKPVHIDLGEAKQIDRIVVTTETYTRGEYAIYGSSGTAVDTL